MLSIRQTFTGSALVGGAMVLIVLVLAIGAPWLALHDPAKQDLSAKLLPPAFTAGGNWAHPFGTDGLGRDLWARIIWGLRTSLLVAVPAVALAVIVGVGIGTLAGYFAGIADALLMRLTDIQMAFPFIILAISILSVTTPGILVLIVVLSLAAWPTYARVMRSIVLVDAQADYVLVAKSIGASHARIIVQYLLRNVFLTVLILSTLDVATMIVLEALLSFLGLGIQPPTPSLGVVMADGRNYLAIGGWWITTMPGVMILFALLGMNLLGDALQSRLDPRLRRL
jgi:peptide/nickel transport system permease protein